MTAPPTDQAAPERSEAAVFRLHPLRKRADFLRAARARKVPTEGFLLQVRKRSEGEETGEGLRVGFTCSRKVGNAVARNRAKRRLREVAGQVLPVAGRAGHDYVLIGRPNVTTTRDFQALCDDLRRAIDKVHGDTE